MRSTDVQVLARSEPEKLPLVVRRAVGNGWVYTALPPFFGADRLAPPVLRALDTLLVPLQPVSIVDGVPALYWTSTLMVGGTARVAALSNNAGALWNGTVRVQVGDSGAPCGRVACECVWTGASLPCKLSSAGANPDQQPAVDVFLSIEPYDVALVKAACTGA